MLIHTDSDMRVLLIITLVIISGYFMVHPRWNNFLGFIGLGIDNFSLAFDNLEPVQRFWIERELSAISWHHPEFVLPSDHPFSPAAQVILFSDAYNQEYDIASSSGEVYEDGYPSDVSVAHFSYDEAMRANGYFFEHGNLKKHLWYKIGVR